MPTEEEIAKALDTLQLLIQGPLPGARERKEMFMQIYKVLHKLQTSHDLEAKLKPQKEEEEEGDNLDLPFLDMGER